MKISYNWLKNYIGTDLNAEEAAALLTSSGLEVEDISSYETIAGGLKHVVIGEVLEKEKHPDADKLSVTKVNVGEEVLQIVCGAPNVAAGQKVVVALVGAALTFSNGEKITIKKSKIRGVESNGMICAEDELGIGNSHEGIMVLPAETPVGMTAATYFDVSVDEVFDVNLTPNRGDAFSHIGVARDLNAVLMQRLKKPSALCLPNLSNVQASNNNPIIEVNIDSDKCIRYSGALIKNIQVAPSPAWLVNALKAIGIKPLNNIVDITNYVLHEFGQPLHAFDADKIKGQKIVVKEFASEQIFKTLDANEVKINSSDLMICNAEEAMCIAGVYGGFDAGISNETKNIFIESACFDAVSIRKTATRLNLRTDAAMHFEKGADPNICVEALKRAVELICKDQNTAEVHAITDVYPNPVALKKVALTYKNVTRLIGKEIDKTDIKNILQSLGIAIENETEAGFVAVVPSNKTEVTREADLIEEILRIYGFDLIDVSNDVYASLSYRPKVDAQKMENHAANFLLANGFFEMMTNPISQSKYYKDDQANIVKLLNSMTSELDMMRKSMLFGGLESIAYNLNRKNNKLRFFEFGSTYTVNENGKYKQQRHLVLFMAGLFQEKTWQSEQTKSTFFHLKYFAERLLQCLGIEDCNCVEASDENAQYAMQLQYRNKVIASVSALSKKLCKEADIKEEVFFADILWDEILQIQATKKTKYKAVSKFPAVKRDLALVLPDNVTYESLKATAKKELKQQLLSVNLFDLYKGDKIESDKKSMALSFSLGDEQKTLTDADIEKMMNKLMLAFEKEYGAILRK